MDTLPFELDASGVPAALVVQEPPAKEQQWSPKTEKILNAKTLELGEEVPKDDDGDDDVEVGIQKFENTFEELLPAQ